MAGSAFPKLLQKTEAFSSTRGRDFRGGGNVLLEQSVAIDASINLTFGLGDFDRHSAVRHLAGSLAFQEPA